MSVYQLTKELMNTLVFHSIGFSQSVLSDYPPRVGPPPHPPPLGYQIHDVTHLSSSSVIFSSDL